jgi:hypothetical protein
MNQVTFLFILIFSISTFSQQNDLSLAESKSSPHLEETFLVVPKNQILSRFFISNNKISGELLKVIGENYEIINKSELGYEVVVPQDNKKLFLELAPDAELKEFDISESVRQIYNNTRFMQSLVASQKSLGIDDKPFSKSRDFYIFNSNDDKTYHSFKEVQEKLENYSKKYPEIAEYFEYGRSKNNLPLIGLKISDNVSQDEDETELMFTGSTHGDEIITTEILLGLIDQLLTGYGLDSRMTDIIDKHELFLIPVVNADGFSIQARYDGNEDPNRSYPYPEDPNVTPTPSIAALIDFFNKRDIKGSIDFHASGGIVMFPWAYKKEYIDPIDYKELDFLTTLMSEVNGYRHGPISEVIYIAKGSSCDYYYWQKQTLAVGIEVGFDKAPAISLIQKYIDEQSESFYKFIEYF